MSQTEFEHIQLSSLGDDVFLIELSTHDFQGPKLAQELGTELSHVLAQDWAKRLVLDFRKVEYLSSTGFAVIFGRVAEARKKGIKIKLCGMDGAVELGAGIVGLDKVTEIHANRESALKAFKEA